MLELFKSPLLVAIASMEMVYFPAVAEVEEGEANTQQKKRITKTNRNDKSLFHNDLAFINRKPPFAIIHLHESFLHNKAGIIYLLLHTIIIIQFIIHFHCKNCRKCVKFYIKFYNKSLKFLYKLRHFYKNKHKRFGR